MRNRQIRASGIYETRGKYYRADARRIEPCLMPDFDLIRAEFPRQSLSFVGKRLGFANHIRWTFFFEIIRITAAKRPVYLFMGNVPGLISHERGRTFETILTALVELKVSYRIMFAYYCIMAVVVFIAVILRCMITRMIKYII